jgi:hypothetical protein
MLACANKQVGWRRPISGVAHNDEARDSPPGDIFARSPMQCPMSARRNRDRWRGRSSRPSRHPSRRWWSAVTRWVQTWSLLRGRCVRARCRGRAGRHLAIDSTGSTGRCRGGWAWPVVVGRARRRSRPRLGTRVTWADCSRRTSPSAFSRPMVRLIALRDCWQRAANSLSPKVWSGAWDKNNNTT